MREFKCYDCGHTWELPFGQGGRGVDQVCPECGSSNVHRVGGEYGRGRGGKGWGQRRGGVEDLGESDEV
ncbi:MAG: hypothetical protein R6U57_00730 [Anaerolineales bacterium]